MKSRCARLTASQLPRTTTTRSPSAAALFLQHQRRTYAAKANAEKCGEFKTDVFGHHTVKIGEGRLLVLPSTRGFNPFTRPTVYEVTTGAPSAPKTAAAEGAAGEWKWEEKSVSTPFPQVGPRGHLFGGQQLIVAGTVTTLGPLKKKGLVSLNTSTFAI
jgi:uncharacterized low-complexity protein